MNELKLNELEVKYTMPTITVELAPLVKQVDEIVKQYKGFVIGEDDIESGKKTVANLNKTAKAISDKRIEIVKSIKAPIDEFENGIKELTKRIEIVSKDIKSQLDDYEEKRKEAKKKIILKYENWHEYMIFDEKWLNKGFELEEIYNAIDNQKTNYDNQITLIKTNCKLLNLDSKKYEDLLWQGRDITSIVDLISNDKTVIENSQFKQENITISTPITFDIASQDTTVYERKAVIKGTKNQLKVLMDYAKQIGVVIESLK